MSTERPPPPGRGRRRLQFSLRALFVVTLLVAMVLGWYRRQVYRAQDEREAVEELTRLGAHVQFYNEPRAQEARPQWLRPIFADQVTVIYDGDAPEEVLVHLHRIRNLWRLYLDGSSVTDEDLREVASLRGLGRLGLRATSVSDAGVEHLVRLRSLDTLDLAHTRVTNRALDSLRRLRLNWLDVTGTHVTEDHEKMEEWMPRFSTLCSGPAQSEAQRRAAARLERQGAHVSIRRIEGQEQVECDVFIDAEIRPGSWKGSSSDLASLTQLPSVRFLYIRGVLLDDTAVTNLRPVVDELQCLRVMRTSLLDPQLVQLVGTDSTDQVAAGRSLSRLEDLMLSDVPITDQAVRSLERLANLKRLDLTSTRITDAGLVHLSKLTRLESLTLDGTQIRGNGLKHLQRLKDLKSLELNHTRIADGTLVHLAPITSLEVLKLCRTPITDACLPDLKKLRQLRVLSIEGTPVTPTAADELRRALSSTEVVYP